VFNVGGMELIVIGLVALIVLGPDKLPGALRQLGSAVGELRRISQGFQTDLRAAMHEAERDVERERRAADAASGAAAPATNAAAGTAPDPGAAMAAAQAELDAMEASGDDAQHGTDREHGLGDEPRPSSDPAA
jgi:sec-independent protein translocase protein TatB